MNSGKNTQKHLSIRMEEPLLDKLRFIAHYHDRSLNHQFNHIIRIYVRDFEQEKGPIMPEIPQKGIK